MMFLTSVFRIYAHSVTHVRVSLHRSYTDRLISLGVCCLFFGVVAIMVVVWCATDTYVDEMTRKSTLLVDLFSFFSLYLTTWRKPNSVHGIVQFRGHTELPSQTHGL